MAKKPHTYIEIRVKETQTDVYLIAAGGHLAKWLKTFATKEEAEAFAAKDCGSHKVYYK